MTKELKNQTEPQIKGQNVTKGLTTLAAIEARLGSLAEVLRGIDVQPASLGVSLGAFFVVLLAGYPL